MEVIKDVEDSLPIEVLQKDLIITEEELRNHPILKLTVSIIKFNIMILGNRRKYALE